MKIYQFKTNSVVFNIYATNLQQAREKAKRIIPNNKTLEFVKIY